MQYKVFEDENGEYQDNKGNHYHILECNEAISSKGKNIGFSEYDNLDLALKGFGLTKINLY